MFRALVSSLFVVMTAGALHAAELAFDFGQYRAGELPKGSKSLLAGTGRQGDWKIVMDDIPSLMKGFTPTGRNQRAVLAQVSRDATDFRYPLLLLNEEIYADFKFTTSFKVMEGDVEQMAGIVFRAQDEKNFYVFRANVKDGNLAFFPMINGQVGQIFRTPTTIKKGEWHELSVECEANTIRCMLDGRQVLPPPATNAPAGVAMAPPKLIDNTFKDGRVGLMTKADALSYFVDAKMTYKPRVAFAQKLVEDALASFPRLINLTIHAPTGPNKAMQVIAAKNPKDRGQAGRDIEKDIYTNGHIWTEKQFKTFVVMMPLHDRNGDTVASATVVMTTFIGQTENNAIARAMPVVKQMEMHIQSAKDLLE